MTVKINVKADKLCIILLDFRQWSGTTVLRESDIKVGTDGKLPPKAVIAQLGQKNVLEPKILDRFNTIKARAQRFLNDNGVPYLGGYAVPLDRATEVLAKLDGFVADYEAAKADFINRYDELVESWIQQNPDFAEELRAAKKSRSEVDARIYARYSAVRVQPLSTNEQQVEQFNEEVEGLSERLLKSVAQTAGRLSLGTLGGKKVKSPIRPVPTLKKISSKLKGLSFLDDGILPVADMIDALLAKVPADGRIAGPLFWETQAVVSVLSDVDRMKRIADGTLSLDVWKENFLPAEEKPMETLELVQQMQTPAGDMVDVPPVRCEPETNGTEPDLDSALRVFIEEHRRAMEETPEKDPEEPKPAAPIPSEPEAPRFAPQRSFVV